MSVPLLPDRYRELAGPYSTVSVSVFGAAITLETNCPQTFARLEEEWHAFETGYPAGEAVTRVIMTRFDRELTFCHARHELITQEGASVWPCRKCVGDFLYDDSPHKRFLAYTDDVDAIVSEVGWIVSHVAYRHLDPGTIALHASAVVDDSGRGVLILGQSDAGKSTLAALMVAHGWRLVSNETAYLNLGPEPRIRGLPSPIGLEQESIELVEGLAGVDPTSGRFVRDSYGTRFSEAEAHLQLLVLPSLSPDRPLAIFPSPMPHALEQLQLRRIEYAIYRYDTDLPDRWREKLLGSVPSWRVDGRLDDLSVVDWIERAALGNGHSGDDVGQPG